MTVLRVLSLHQPWASLVALNVKRIETRSWGTKHRGRIGIASTARKPVPGCVGDYEVYPADPPGEIHPNHTKERPARLYRNGTGDLRVGGRWCPLAFGAIVATANLVDCVPMVPCSSRDHDGNHRVFVGCGTRGDELWVTRRGPGPAVDINDQLPYGDFAPGRWAWLLDDIKPTTERCPWCLGDRADPDDEGWSYHGMVEPGSRGPCPVCDGDGVCDPVPVKGRQDLWKWAG